MTIQVFVQNEAGSDIKHCHDEHALVFQRSIVVSHRYPYPYGFVIGTVVADGCCADCFVITNQVLRTGQIVECDVVGLMEQIEDGADDHNILARPVGETIEMTPAVEAALTEHVLACFAHVEGKQMRVGRFLEADAAVVHLETAGQRGGRAV